MIDAREQLSPVYVPRPDPVGPDPAEEVRAIVADVRLRGDGALLELTHRFHGGDLDAGRLRVDEDTVARSRGLVRPEVIVALAGVRDRLRANAERQLRRVQIEATPEDEMTELIRPLRRVGIHVPRGPGAHASAVLTAAVPAQVAGVSSIAVVSPPDARGEVAEATLAACSVAGITEVYRVGGAPAIAALAFGTETVRPVDKIVGAGDVYAVLAKQQVQGWVGADAAAPGGDTMIVTDASVPPAILAADLVAQAEHGRNGTHVLTTWDPDVLERVMRRLELEVARHDRPDDVENSLIEGGRGVLVRDVDQALDAANAFAPACLQLSFEGARERLGDVVNAGAVFVGRYTAVPLGEYIGSASPLVPSRGSARWQSGSSVHDFLRRTYVVDVDRATLEAFAPHVDALAAVDRSSSHSRTVRLRLDDAFD